MLKIKGGLFRLRKNSIRRGFTKDLCQGMTSVVPHDAEDKGRALQAPEKLNPKGIHEGFVSGHDFSRAANS